MRMILAGSYAFTNKYYMDCYNIIKEACGYFSCLESFPYFPDWLWERVPLMNDLLVDSGAYSAVWGFNKNGRYRIDWGKYIYDYGTWIKRNNVQHFIELDIELLVGMKKYEYYRKMLEDITGLDPIPVVHKNRGLAWFEAMLEEKHEIVAFGGFVGKDVKNNDREAIRKYVNMCLDRGMKVHGLGLGNVDLIRQIPVSISDATSWTSSRRFSRFTFFNGFSIKYYRAPYKYHEMYGNKINCFGLRGFGEMFNYVKQFENIVPDDWHFGIKGIQV